jgi:hypothetical protein
MAGGALRMAGEFAALGPGGTAAVEGANAAGESRLESARLREQGVPVSGTQEAVSAAGKGLITAAGTAIAG